MSLLSEQIRALRNSMTFVAFANLTGVNRQTLADLETGQSVKFCTLEQIVQSCSVTQEQRANILIGWIRAELGDRYYSQLEIKQAGKAGGLNENEARCISLFRLLSGGDQEDILRAMEFGPLRKCLRAMTEAVSSLQGEKSESTKALISGDHPGPTKRKRQPPLAKKPKRA
jgi:transcriptional regulator with XRE-family HTH domain